MRIIFYIEIYHCTLIPMTTSSSRQSKKDTNLTNLIDQSVSIEFWSQVAKESEQLGVDVDYFLAEFYTS